ncbi:MaoC/PaaZ C-terminal domain-containing protein [Cellulomonas sp. URHE0023]|uniref:MaoC/PaaZ C-terminal domain-containing protein n=1 Tax=Cellulomonas sp. URHE0023 TaxID=1380354 RepID=UPI00047F2FCE|nr:MaoC/PaaZ C-terminal domain-containing protein [Cellulomonas sp. URHE0023]
MTVVVLPDVPGLGGLYARAAASSVRPRRQTDLPDVAYVVRSVRADPAHLTDYQHLLAESASDLLPAGYVHVLAFPVATALMARADFPLPLVGLVHLSNRVTQHRPLSLADTFDVHATATNLRAHRTGTQVDLVTTVSVGDDVTWRGVSTYLAKGVFLQGAGEDDRSPFVPPVPTGQWVLASDTGRRYAAVSGDHNPIHLSSLTAKAFGFPRAIAHGMYTASLALAGVGAARGDAFDWSVDFFKPVLLPSTVSVRIASAGTAGGFDLAAWTSVPHLTGNVTPTP